MNQFTLTKDEFIIRAMAGEVFIHVNTSSRLFYDNSQKQPFRLNDVPLTAAWSIFNGQELLTLEQPELRIERRWKWRKDKLNCTEESYYYYSDTCTLPFNPEGWYKAEDCFIDVEIK